MKRALKSHFKCSAYDLDRLFACNRISAFVWNDVLNLQSKHVHSRNELQKKLRGLYPISSQSVQAVTDKYYAACLATKAAKKSGLEKRYPRRRKKKFPDNVEGGRIQALRQEIDIESGHIRRQKTNADRSEIADLNACGYRASQNSANNSDLGRLVKIADSNRRRQGGRARSSKQYILRRGFGRSSFNRGVRERRQCPNRDGTAPAFNLAVSDKKSRRADLQAVEVQERFKAL